VPDEFYRDKTLFISYKTLLSSLLAISVKLMIFNIMKPLMKLLKFTFWRTRPTKHHTLSFFLIVIIGLTRKSIAIEEVFGEKHVNGMVLPDKYVVFGDTIL